MVGMVDFGIVKPELAGSFGAGMQASQENRMRTEEAQLKLERLKQDQAMLTDLQTKLQAAGKSTDPNEFFKAMIQSGNPDHMAKGYEGMQRYQELQRANELLRREAPELFGTPAAAAPAAAPSVMRAAPAPAPTNMLGSGTYGMGAEPTNALAAQAAAAPAAAPAAPVNALAAPEDRTRELRNKILLYSSSGDPRLKAMADVYKTELQELTKPQNVAPGHQLYSGGKVVYTAPAAPTELDRLIATRDALAPNDPRRAVYDAAIKKQSSHAPGTTVNVSTEKKYSEQFANKMADTDIAKMTTAEKAPQLAESANRIIDLVKQGNLFVGPAADIKLNIARAMNVAGASNQEKIANTELLLQATGKSTLDAIKGAGLGTGQGFTDKDLLFLEKIAGGNISFTPQTLTEMARLQHKTASESAKAWNTRVQQMPKSAIEGTGLSTAPVTVAPLATTAARPTGVGANWTLERDAAGNTAWVSPDRKSFKEAK